MSGFERIERGHGRTLVLLPGWATDRRVFSTLDLPCNYLLVDEFSPFGFADVLAEHLPPRVSLLGWSLGGFVAADYAARFPERVEELILVSVRPGYPAAEIAAMRSDLERNRRGRLIKFYNDCFTPAESALRAWFRAELQSSYLESQLTPPLRRDLDYLAAATIEPANLRAVRTTIVHGRDDHIAPAAEIFSRRYDWPEARWLLLDGGHLPFLHTGFTEALRATDDHP